MEYSLKNRRAFNSRFHLRFRGRNQQNVKAAIEDATRRLFTGVDAA
jgi:hypothetical protein